MVDANATDAATTAAAAAPHEDGRASARTSASEHVIVGRGQAAVFRVRVAEATVAAVTTDVDRNPAGRSARGRAAVFAARAVAGTERIGLSRSAAAAVGADLRARVDRQRRGFDQDRAAAATAAAARARVGS